VKLQTLALACLLIARAAADATAPATVVGVLEEPQCENGRERFVLPVFVSQSGEWTSLVKIEQMQAHVRGPMTWDIGLGGRKTGTLQTLDPEPPDPELDGSGRDMLLALASPDTTSSVPSVNRQFAGWCRGPGTRPQVVVSGGRIDDADGWKPVVLTRRDIKRVLEAFKANAGPAGTCADTSDVAKPFDYGLADVEAVAGYRDRAGHWLATLRLWGESGCDGPIDDAWSSHTFLVSGTSVKHLGVGLELVDAGDFDGNGASELLFWFSGYNRDGYVLFFGRASDKVEYLWGYH
jgi:hypothetical protein